MNHLLKTIDITVGGKDFKAVTQNITAAIHLIAVDTDLLFTAQETRKTYELLKQNGNEAYYHEIQSVHGHDAFLIEWEQLAEILAPVFQSDKNSKKFHKDTQRRRKETESIRVEV